MCSKPEARDGRETLGGAIDRFERCAAAIRPTPPKLTVSTRTLNAIAEIYRGAAATVPLVRRRVS